LHWFRSCFFIHYRGTDTGEETRIREGKARKVKREENISLAQTPKVILREEREAEEETVFISGATQEQPSYTHSNSILLVLVAREMCSPVSRGMSDVQSVSILSTLNGLEPLDSDDDISHLTSHSSSSSCSSKTSDSSKFSIDHQKPHAPPAHHSPHQPVRTVQINSQQRIISREETKNKEFISASRLRAQRNIRQVTQAPEEKSLIPKAFKYSICFWSLYLFAGVLFYAFTEQWTVLDSVYFISLSGLVVLSSLLLTSL
jgi:hypothetical protein